MKTTPESKSAIHRSGPRASYCASFEVWPDGRPEWVKTINARSAGKAKGEYHRELSESWPGIPFTKIRARKIGRPVTSERFRANAKYRGMSDVECGHRVSVLGNSGTITGHTPSANFEVLFDDDAPHYAGLKLSVHPQDVVLILTFESAHHPGTDAWYDDLEALMRARGEYVSDETINAHRLRIGLEQGIWIGDDFRFLRDLDAQKPK